MMKAIHFRLFGRIGHFLRAEAGVNALSYPIPTRTVLLGIIGAVLGLEKDQPQQVLEPAYIAVSGKMTQTHWHRVKMRKDPPKALPMIINKKQKQDISTSPEMATLILQEWLINPSYEIWVILSEPYQNQFQKRLQQRCWYFQPSLGLSEMMADIEYIGTNDVVRLPPGDYEVSTVIPQGLGQINLQKSCIENVSIQLLQMPKAVTPERVFIHDKYFWECEGRSLTIQTSEAYQIGETVVMFL
jgi:CRISPR-associated protein Cas5h